VDLTLQSTLKGSLLETFFPKGWDLAKIDSCCSIKPEKVLERQSWWNREFTPVQCETPEDFYTMMGHEIAYEIKKAKDSGNELVLILPVGPMGMYRWVIYFLRKWEVDCSHVHGFNMDEWSDDKGNTPPCTNPGAFQYEMEHEFYGELEELTVPKAQRHFATKESLPKYSEQIAALKERGAKTVVVYGIGRDFHIAFWEPQFAQDYPSESEWKKRTHGIGVKLHPLTVEQNAILSFKSRTTMVPTHANTIGPGIFLDVDYAIGGCHGTLCRGEMWQGMSLWVTLRYGPDIWVTSSFMPTLPGVLFFNKDLTGPLVP